MPDTCTHITAVSSIKTPRRHQCDECAKTGDDAFEEY
jgi:hypothetical protein